MSSLDDAMHDRWDAFTVRAVLEATVVDNRALREAELVRSRHALAYLKGRIGNEGMRDLLADDLARTTAQVREWVARSAQRWRTAQVELIVPGRSAAAFHRWYRRAMDERRQEVLRAGHPEHFILHLSDAGIEVVENIGETDLPWRIFYRNLPDDVFPLPWEAGYPVRFGAEIVDSQGLRIGYTMHHSRDTEDGLHLLLRTLLPEAAPHALVEQHLCHFAIEFTNWTRVAWLEERNEAKS